MHETVGKHFFTNTYEVVEALVMGTTCEGYTNGQREGQMMLCQRKSSLEEDEDCVAVMILESISSADHHIVLMLT